VEGDSEQIEDQKHAGEGLLAMTETVLEVVAVGLEHYCLCRSDTPAQLYPPELRPQFNRIENR